MTEYYTSVTFRFLNANHSTNPEKDEVFKIWYNGTSYLWVYTYESKKSRHLMEFSSKQELYASLHSYFTLLAYDSEPYHSMQVILPAMPSVMLEMKDILPAFSTIENLLDLTFDQAPKQVPVAVAQEYIKMYEKVDDDMPPLVPLHYNDPFEV
jgi:hypothetical protein